VSLASSNLAKSIAYWNEMLTLKIFEKKDKSVLLGFSDDQAKLELVDIG
jgi:catechol-2,3-dioxygenase